MDNTAGYLVEIPSFVINLDRRPDRIEAFYADWPAFLPPPERLQAVDGRQIDEADAQAFAALTKRKKADPLATARGALGCLRSHRAALEIALDREYEAVAIYEDDAVYVDHRALTMMPAPPTAGIIMLGAWPGRLPSMRGWHRMTGKCIAAHAYVIRGEAIGAYHQALTNEQSEVDHAWRSVREAYGAYLAWPLLSRQRLDYSDIEGRVRRDAGPFVGVTMRKS